jgi:hypothetical protein
MPTWDDISIEVRQSGGLARVGQVDVDQLTAMQAIKRFNAVGAWTLTLPNDYWLTAELKVPGTGCLFWLYDRTFLSGPMIKWTSKQTSADPVGRTTFVGADDMIHLNDRDIYPTPSTADVTAQTDAYDTASGDGESVMKHYVDVNLGPSAATVRQQQGVVLGPNLLRGASVTYNGRFEVLGQALADLGTASGLGFDLVQQGNTLLFDVYTPYDVSDSVRMDIFNDMLTDVSSALSAPKVTRAIVGGQGDLTARNFVEVHDDLSDAAERQWGRRIELFVDYSNAGDESAQVQSGQNRIEDGGRTVVSVTATPSDNETMIFGKDWFVGFQVAVVVDQQDLVAPVSEAIIAMDATSGGINVGATLGDPSIYDWEAAVIKQQSEHERRIAALEKR